MENSFSARKPAGLSYLFIILILGALDTISPFSIDMYLPAFSQIAKDLGSTPAIISLSVSSYFIGLAIAQVCYGPILDRFGRKKPIYFGLGVYIVSCMGCILSRTVDSLIFFRLIQALGGCVAQVAAMAMVRDFFPVEESAKVFSLLFLVLGISPLLAPTVGGYIVILLGWRWIFILLSLIVLVMIGIIALFLPERYEPDPSVSLRIGAITSTFSGIFKNRQFSTYGFSGAFSFAMLFIYVAGAPLIFMQNFHVRPQVFGEIFAFLSVGFIGSNQLNILLLRKYKSGQIFRVSLLAQALTAVVFLVGAWRNWYGLPSTIALFFIAVSCLGMNFPNGSALALAPFTRNLGSASALLGFLQMGIGAIASSLIGLFNSASTFTIVAAMAASTTVALVILLINEKKLGTSQI